MTYQDPLVNRYASKEIVDVFSEYNRYLTWRKLWLSLARNQKKLGLNISDQQIKEIEDNLDKIDFADVALLEKELKHDVMAHLHSFAKLLPNAKSILHLGATSETIKDNADLILIKDALKIIEFKLVSLIKNLSDFALKYKDLPTLAYTHFQVAQPTTVGKRACLWLQSFFMDLKHFHNFSSSLKFRGIKGTTGSLASFKELFNNDYDKVKELNSLFTKDFGFDDSFIISGQTYDRKVDVDLLNTFSGIAQSAIKITNDIRLLQGLKELGEGFSKNQIGSSAMPYKQNPILSERVSSLSKYLLSLPSVASNVASTQWLERTLDDSAARRIILPQSFFALDAILKFLNDIILNLQVNEKVILKNLTKEIPFIATENIMMEATKNGGNRQELHEKIRQYSVDVKKAMIEEDAENTLLQKIQEDKNFKLSKEKLDEIANINNFKGFCIEQVDDFINNEIYKYFSLLQNCKN